MSWFSKKNQDRSFKYCGIIGATAGLLWGFSLGGLGGAILFLILGTIAGWIVGAFVSIIFDKREMEDIGAGCLLIGIPILLMVIIGLLWGVGN